MSEHEGSSTVVPKRPRVVLERSSLRASSAGSEVGDEDEDVAQDGESSWELDQYRGWEDDIVLDGESGSESVIIF